MPVRQPGPPPVVRAFNEVDPCTDPTSERATPGGLRTVCHVASPTVSRILRVLCDPEYHWHLLPSTLAAPVLPDMYTNLGSDLSFEPSK